MKKLMVIGNPIAHSLSPLIHNKALQKLSLDNEYIYGSLQLQEDELGNFLDKIRQGLITGVNVTLPYKKRCIQYLDILDQTSKDIGAVNTIVHKNNKLYGYNTDSVGFIQSIKDKKISLKNKNILILGAGGSACAICNSLLQERANIFIKNRSYENALKLVLKFEEKGNIDIFKDKLKDQVEIVVNCTSVGLDGVSIPFNFQISKDLELIIDIIYNPFITPFLKKGIDLGIPILNGVDMLVNQGAESFRLFTNQEPDRNLMKKEIIDYFGRCGKN